MADFQLAVALVLKHEGGYVNDPADPGGETNFGISKRSYPNVDIKALTAEAASTIYERDYWKPYMAACSDQHLANALLDTAVNQGQAVAKTMFDACTGSLREFQTQRIIHYCSLVVAKPGMGKFLKGWIRRALDV